MSTIIVGEGLDAIVARFDAMPKQIERASIRAINKTTQWVAGQAVKELAAIMGVAQKAIKDRIVARMARSDLPKGQVWIGLNRLGATQRRFGNLRQTKSGAIAGGVRFAGAFVATMGSTHAAIFKRRSKARLPIDKQYLKFDSPAARAVLASKASHASERLKTVFAQEMNYEVNVKGAA